MFKIKRSDIVKVSIEKEGEFHVGWTHSHNRQCGNVGTEVLRFRVVITSSIDGVNEEGWIIDNNAILKFFNDQYRSVKDFASCEKIAHRSCEGLAEAVRAAGARPEYIKVSVTGIPGSWITCEWWAGRQR